MLRISFAIAMVLFVGLSFEVYAQDADQRTRELVTALDKTKYKKKEKATVTVEIYIDIKNEALVQSDPTGYSGNYGGDGYRLILSVARDGSATGEGYDRLGGEASQSNFRLRDARVQGALLTGTKVYDDGKTESFEAVFARRTVTTGKNPNEIHSSDTTFGVGFIQNNREWTNRVFLQRR